MNACMEAYQTCPECLHGCLPSNYFVSCPAMPVFLPSLTAMLAFLFLA
jgi:hypothetical protein